MLTIDDHVADVFGIAVHKDRPFNFVTSSRDTTIRVWQIHSSVATLPFEKLVDPMTSFESPQEDYLRKGEALSERAKALK